MVNTPARHGLIQKDTVWAPFLYLDGERGDRKIIRLNRRNLTLLAALNDDSVTSFEEACQRAKMTREQALHFLRRKDVREWLDNKAREASIQLEWNRPEKWYALADKWIRAPIEEKPTKADVEIWKEIGDRVVPKPSRNSEPEGPKVTINIDMNAAKEALLRQNAIEAQIVKEQAA
jgi:hypothetical protein